MAFLTKLSNFLGLSLKARLRRKIINLHLKWQETEQILDSLPDSKPKKIKLKLILQKYWKKFILLHQTSLSNLNNSSNLEIHLKKIDLFEQEMDHLELELAPLLPSLSRQTNAWLTKFLDDLQHSYENFQDNLDAYQEAQEEI